MEMLLAIILSWLSANFDLHSTGAAPQIKQVAPQQLASMRYGAGVSHGRELVALYDDKTHTIFLPEGWTGSTPTEVSVLLHEVVHHLQNVGQIRYECAGAREAVAYAAQEKWLGLFRKSLESEFGLDPFTLKISTLCM